MKIVLWETYRPKHAHLRLAREPGAADGMLCGKCNENPFWYHVTYSHSSRPVLASSVEDVVCASCAAQLSQYYILHR
jgi:hypothetical protein